MDSKALAVAEAVKSSNDSRASNAREFVGVLYFFIALIMMLYAANVSVLTSWMKKVPFLPAKRSKDDTKPALINILVHFIVLTAVYYIVTAAAGVVGLCVMTGLYCLISLIIIIILFVQRDVYFVDNFNEPGVGSPTTQKRIEDLSTIAVAVAKKRVDEKESPAQNPLAVQSGDREGAENREDGNTVQRVQNTPVVEDLEHHDSSTPPQTSLHPKPIVSVTEENPESAPQSNDSLPHHLRRNVHKTEDESVTKLEHTKALKTGMQGVRTRAPHYWQPTNFPLAMSIRQGKWYILSLLSVLLILIILVIMGFAFGAKDYKIARGNETIVEFQPKIASTALVAMYIYPGMASNMRMQWPVEQFTFRCGEVFRKKLKTTIEKKAEIQEAWIDKYSINMTEYVREYYINYVSPNDWFTRAIKLELRPLPADPKAIVSPADCRLLVFENSDESEVWVKGSKQSAKAITADVAGEYWNGGAMVIARLAPQDYHRFHSPATGIIKSITHISGTYWSVSSDAAQSENDAFLNKRIVVVIGTSFGDVAYVAIGATCVGSVIFEDPTGREYKAGDNVTIGDQLGIMQFGGSTVVVYFPPGGVTLDPALVKRSQLPVETRMLTNEEIGVWG